MSRDTVGINSAEGGTISRMAKTQKKHRKGLLTFGTPGSPLKKGKASGGLGDRRLRASKMCRSGMMSRQSQLFKRGFRSAGSRLYQHGFHLRRATQGKTNFA